MIKSQSQKESSRRFEIDRYIKRVAERKKYRERDMS